MKINKYGEQKIKTHVVMDIVQQQLPQDPVPADGAASNRLKAAWSYFKHSKVLQLDPTSFL